MNETWWVDPSQLDVDQKKVISAGADQDLLILGPPGSGKTNLLLLRANYLRSVNPRVLFITFTRTLCEFLKSSPNIDREDQIKSNEIKTFMSWALSFLKSHSIQVEDIKDFNQKRDLVISTIIELVEREQLGKFYDVIFIDEVQDLYECEIKVLSLLAERVNAAGDSRQAIWDHKEGLPTISSLVDETVILTRHYRVGRNICNFADRILPPKAGDAAMVDGSNYDESTRPSTVTSIRSASVDQQFEACIEELKKQIRYIADEPIAVLARKNDVLDEFWECISEDDELAAISMVQRSDGYQAFGPDSLIRIMTVASAKGTEGRAVHLLCADSYGENMRELAFTAVTRAKTEVTLHHSEPLSGHMTPASGTLPDDIAAVF